MSEIKFEWLRDVFNSLRANDSITTTEGRLNGLPESSHLLAMLSKAGLITIIPQPGNRPAEVRKTSEFGRRNNNQLLDLLHEKLKAGTRITTHRRRKISEIRQWRESTVYYISTGETAGRTEDTEATSRAAQSKSLAFKQAAIDERERIVDLAKRVRRVGQQEFSEKIRKNYGGRCAVTGCATPEVLEAAHIKTFNGQMDDHAVCNGILLRADIHALLDRLLITFSDDGRGLIVSDILNDPTYEYLATAKVRKPVRGTELSRANREDHRRKFSEKWNPS